MIIGEIVTGHFPLPGGGVFGHPITLYPMIVLHHFTMGGRVLVGTLVLLPVILMYSSWSYWVFRGKVRADIGYH